MRTAASSAFEDLRRLHDIGAMNAIAKAAEKGEVLTGLLYVAPDAQDLHGHLNTYDAAFNKLGEKDLCPGSAMLDKINAALR